MSITESPNLKNQDSLSTRLIHPTAKFHAIYAVEVIETGKVIYHAHERS